MIIPYVIVHFLTNFNRRQSTGAQRVFTMAWLVTGQVLEVVRLFPYSTEIFGMTATLLIITADVGGLVVVGQMIVSDMVCSVM